MALTAHALLNQLQTAVLLIDGSDRILLLNEAAEMLLGMGQRQLLGSPLTHWLQADELSEQAFCRCRAGSSLHQPRAKLTRMDGVIIDANLRLSSANDDQSQLILEIQHHGQLPLLESELNLEEQSQLSADLLRNLAHEIRNPLGGLMGAAQLLERELTEGPLQEYASVLVNESRRLRDLLDRMLAPQAPATLQLMNLHQITEAVYQLMQLQLPQTTRLTRDYDPSLPDIRMAPQQVQQALLNLVKNAAEAITDQSDGRILLRTRISSQSHIGSFPHKQVVRIDVEDNGPGVPEQLKHSLFFPTISGKGGSGLGLGIAQSLIQHQGGLIEFTSRPGQTIFSILLPVDPHERSHSGH